MTSATINPVIACYHFSDWTYIIEVVGPQEKPYKMNKFIRKITQSADELYNHILSENVLGQSRRQFRYSGNEDINVVLLIVNRAVPAGHAEVEKNRKKVISYAKSGEKIDRIREWLDAPTEPRAVRVAASEKGIKEILLQDLQISSKLRKRKPNDSSWYDYKIPKGVLFEYERFCHQ